MFFVLRMLLFVLIGLCLFGHLHAVAATPLDSLPIEVSEVIVTGHQYSEAFRYSRPPDPALGALVRLVIQHRDEAGAPVALRLRVNGKTASEWLASNDWSWYAFPENLGTEAHPYELAPGSWAVFTFNGATADWGVNREIRLEVADAHTGHSESVSLTLKEDPLRLRSIVCLAENVEDIIPENMVIHVTNDRNDPLTLREVAVYPDASLSSRQVAAFETRPGDGVAHPRERMVILTSTGPLPLTHGLVETVFETTAGDRIHRFARLRFKADRFDIGSGWLGTRTAEGVVGLQQESYLKTLARMHVNLFWGEHVPGYTDATGPDGLYTRYPMRQKSYFEDIERYNSDAWVARIHGVDRLGEPQHIGMPPMEVYDTLKKYDAARYPTTLTLSDEKGWRYYAGIVDFPHYDSYRVSAPAMDVWRMYEHWNRPLFWGAPLEGIGVMTRSLRELSEPNPIALWSQNVHPGWQDQFTRKRRSPTPDEILIQAYQGLANGIISLYWYSLETWSLIKYRDGIDITTRIGREIRLLEDLYLKGHASHHERIMGETRPSLELNVINAPDAALLFIMDLDYAPDHEERFFVYDGPRTVEASFPLPRWLRDPADVFRVDADGVHDVAWQTTSEGVQLRDTVDRVGIYLVSADSAERARRLEKLEALKEQEENIGFDPAHNDDDFERLLRDFAFEGPEALEAFH